MNAATDMAILSALRKLERLLDLGIKLLEGKAPPEETDGKDR